MFVTSVVIVVLRRTDDAIRAQNRELLEVNEELERARMQAEESAKQAEIANQAKGEFLAVMSHEIRNPIGALVGIHDLLAESGLTPDQSELIELARGSAKNLLLLVNETLDISKIEAGALALESVPMDLRQMGHALAAMNRPTAIQRGLSFELCLADDLPDSVLGDPTRLHQILQNLIGNALKFTSDGSITLSIAPLPSSEPTGKSVAIRFEVRDTGIGIPPEKSSIIFEKYQQADHTTTRQYGGTGLGLAICKELVGKMGGQIGVESETGHGSRFWFQVSFPKPSR